ncbi:MAG: ABC transporter substrate-binding protein [Opitutales bacterium]
MNSAAGREARATFLASNVGCGIDLFFGGGTYDFAGHASDGRLVPSRIRQTHPEWFTGAVIPATYAGEEFWDPQDRWFGNVLSNYGILCNKDALTRLGFTAPIATWRDLTDPRLVGEVALCDPTKSGSMATAFENLLQQQMQIRLQALRRVQGGTITPELEARAVREGGTRACGSSG